MEECLNFPPQKCLVPFIMLLLRRTLSLKKTCSNITSESLEVSTENYFLNPFKMPTVSDKWKVMLILLAFKSAPLAWLIDVELIHDCTCILLLLYGNTDLNPEEY